MKSDRTEELLAIVCGNDEQLMVIARQFNYEGQGKTNTNLQATQILTENTETAKEIFRLEGIEFTEEELQVNAALDELGWEEPMVREFLSRKYGG